MQACLYEPLFYEWTIWRLLQNFNFTLRTVGYTGQKYFAYSGGIMEVKRKIYDKMLKWKATCNGSKALLIEGDGVKIGLNQEKPSK